MTVTAVLASLVPILWESGIGSDVMKPIAAPIVGGMITSTIHVLILVPVFFLLMKQRELRRGTLARNESKSDLARAGGENCSPGTLTPRKIGLAKVADCNVRFSAAIGRRGQ